MGSIISAVNDDIDAYKRLCQRFGEKVVTNGSSPDCYGKHAKELKKRAHDEDAKYERSRVMRSSVYGELHKMIVGLLGRLEEQDLVEVIDADPSLKKWWSENRMEHDEIKKQLLAKEEQARLVASAQTKLSIEELDAFVRHLKNTK